jgi:CO/xanthine dehydrogenase Mo-binding subunit
LKLISSFDVGRAINRLSVEGQIEGGAVYGMGYGLTEEVILNQGITMTPSFSEYLLPTSMDIPELETILIESGDGVGPFGAKGIGEPSVCSVAPAICNAVNDAIGVRIYDLPLTPEKIVRALKEKRH